MIKVSGTARLKVDYSVRIDMTEEEFNEMPLRNQEELLDNSIDWETVCRNATVDDIDVDEVEES